MRMLSLALLALAAPVVFAQQITVYSNDNVPVGTTRQLTAYVPLAVTTVNWSVNGIAGGNSTYGTVSTAGLYTAPMTVPTNNQVIVRATSTADATKFGSATMTVTQTPPNLWSISPTSVPAGSFTISLNGSNFGANSVVKFGGTTLTSTLISSTSMKATGTALVSQVGTSVPVTVTNTGLGAVTTAPVNLAIKAPLPITTTISPTSATVNLSATRQFTATVTNTTTTGVTWTVNGVAGGAAATGTISTTGLYTAPAALPSPATVTVRATSVADPTIGANATVTVQVPPPPVTVTVSPTSASLGLGSSQQFTSTVTGSANTAVNWTATAGTITSAGLYTAPAVLPNPATVTIKATSAANASSSASASVLIQATIPPGQGTANLSAGRFLEQAAFGPTTAEIAHVKQVGFDGWLTEQFNMPETVITIPAGMNVSAVQAEYLSRLGNAPDQLRQRMIFALGQIIVVSLYKNIYPDEIVPYVQILSKNAFGNYRQLLGDISVSSQMGKYLDLAHSVKPSAGGGANENYARELQQIFTIGLWQLNPDGSQVLDAANQPIPTYNQTTIQQVALALTGWTYLNDAWEDFSAPMQPMDVNHDMRQKTFHGCTLPPNQTTVQDMNATLDCLFNHPNVPPFIATRLIRLLVKSNPSPAYIQRVSTVFANNGTGVRGDLKAVARAILLDPEARNDTAGPNDGRLKDPIYHAVSFVRALNGSVGSAPDGQGWTFSRMAMEPLAPATVFSFYSPLYHIPKSPLFGPEFQIYTPTEAVLRGNFFYSIMNQATSDFLIDMTPFRNAAGNTTQLIDLIDQTLMYGRMPQPMRQSLANAIIPQYDNTSKALTGLYLAVLSGLYAVQY